MEKKEPICNSVKEYAIFIVKSWVESRIDCWVKEWLLSQGMTGNLQDSFEEGNSDRCSADIIMFYWLDHILLHLHLKIQDPVDLCQPQYMSRPHHPVEVNIHEQEQPNLDQKLINILSSQIHFGIVLF